MPRAKAEAVLSRVGWLASQPEEFRARILNSSELRVISAGSSIYGLDEPPGGIYGLAEGFVDVLISAGTLTPMLAHMAMPGWWVGEAALITQTRRRAHLTARSDVSVMYVTESRIERIAADDPLTWRRLAEITVHHLDTALSLVACLAIRDIRLRLLLTLARLVSHREFAERPVELPLSQHELGELTALSRNTIGQVLAALEAEKLVSHSYGRLTVYPDRLQRALVE